MSNCSIQQGAQRDGKMRPELSSSPHGPHISRGRCPWRHYRFFSTQPTGRRNAGHPYAPVENGNHRQARVPIAQGQQAVEYVNDLYCRMKSLKASGKSRGTNGPGPRERGAPGRSRRTLSPSLRHKVLERDGHRCRAPGCSCGHFPVVHHLDPVAAGGKD